MIGQEHKPKRNSKERAEMLAKRAMSQRSRISKAKVDFPANVNPRTKKPHEHTRAKARRLDQLALKSMNVGV